MQRLAPKLVRCHTLMPRCTPTLSHCTTLPHCSPVQQVRAVSSEVSSTAHSSFNPEAYLRFPQFLYDINSKLAQHTEEAVLTKGRLVYTKKYVTVEKGDVAGGLSPVLQKDLKQLSVGCKGLFWRSEIDYTCVPCVFSLPEGAFSEEKFLEELGVNTPSFRLTVVSESYHKGMLEELPIISYLGEDAMNVYSAPIDILSSILDQYKQVYHITVGQGVINPVLQFVVGEKDDKLIGFVSASVIE